jgi:BA14K-like protein
MWRFAILSLSLLWPSDASAGQATGQFQVGITITGKRAASSPGSSDAATEPAPRARAAPFADVVYPRRVRHCLTRYRTYDPAARTYIGHDGKTHRCP